MNKIKKTILTLALLITAATGAWATEFTSLKVGDVLHVGDVINTSTNYSFCGQTLDANFQPATLVRANTSTWDITESETGAYYLIKDQNGSYYGYIMSPMGYEGSYWPVTDTSDGISVTAITPDGSYRDLTFAVHEGSDAPASDVTVAWNKAEKTGTFTMPGGNVTLEPEYYPQATLAFQGLTAAEDAAAKTEAPLAVLAENAVYGGTLMYYVAPDENFSQADAIALAETQWSADIPTAETIDAAGTCYVWYYIKGDAEHSDTDPKPLAVTVLPEPTYAVTFAEGTDPNEWTADPATDVKKGQTVTVTYTGTKKVIGVKAEKKAAAAGPITVTWNDSDITGSGKSFTKDGVTLTAGFIDFDQKIFMSGGTFTTTLGNFTKIEVTADSWGASGTGWSGKTWTGNASSVSYDGDIMGMVKVVFTIEPTN